MIEGTSAKLRIVPSTIRPQGLIQHPHPFVCLVGACVISYGLLLLRIHNGYIPVDDPLQAHVAERVLRGAIPNVDFHDVYTGGLAYLHALSLKLFGVRLFSLRLMLSLFFVVWVPCIWYIATQFVAPVAASLLTILAVSWSVPNYPSPLGSWYSLFFATFCLCSLVRFLRTSNRRWLFVTGLTIGLSFLAKISGLYLFAATGLFLLYLEQNSSKDRPDYLKAHRVYSVHLTVLLSAFVLALTVLIRRALIPSEIYHFLFPSTALALALVLREWRSPRVGFRERTTALRKLVLPLLFGVFVPIAIFLFRYAVHGILRKWFYGVFVLPQQRLGFAFRPAINPAGALACLPLLLVIWSDRELELPILRWSAFVLLSLSCIAALFASLHSPHFVGLVWMSLAMGIPLIVGVAAFRIASPDTSEHNMLLMLLASTAALCSLIQFPFSHLMYFCYVAPLAILATAALIASRENWRPSLLYPVMVFYILFGAVILNSNQIYARGLTLLPLPQRAFSTPRGVGIRGPADVVMQTEEACYELEKHAGGRPIYAGPDSPQFYFLTGLQSSTPNVIETLSGRDGTAQAIIGDIENSGARAVLINRTPDNDSGPPPNELIQFLRTSFPSSREIGFFEVRWKP